MFIHIQYINLTECDLFCYGEVVGATRRVA